MLQFYELMGLFKAGTTDPGGGTPPAGTPVTPATRRIVFTGTSTAPSGAGLPEGTRAFTDAVDPYDVLDFELDLAGLLESGEALASANLNLAPEAALLGLTINSGGGYSTTLTGNILKFYLSIADSDQNNKAFSGTGIYLPLEVRIITNSTPARKKQRTVAVRVVQR